MKLRTIFGIIMLLGILSSCQKNNDDLRYLPADANFVMTITPSVLQTKSGIENFADTKAYKSMLSDIDSNDKVIFNQFEYVFENYKESGINMSLPLFVFSSSKHNGYNKVTGINFMLENESKFSQLIDKILNNTGDSMKLIKDGDLKILVSNKNSSEKIILWNNTTVIGLSKYNGGFNRASLIEYAKDLLKQGSAKSISSNKDFMTFYNKREDISMWINSKFFMQQLPSEYRTMAKMQMPISMDNIYFHYFMQFDNGKMKMNSELVFPDDLKDFLKDYKIVKPHIDKKMMSFIPNKSLMNISFAVNPPEMLRMIRDLYSERQIDTKGMEHLFEMATNIKVEKLFQAVSGDFIFNIHDVKIIDDKSDSISSKKAKWIFSSIFKLDDKKVYQWLINQVDKNKEQMEDGYFVLNKNSGLYICMRNKYVMLTNDKSLIVNFSKDIVLKNSLINSKIADKIDNYSAYAQLNLDYSSYSQDVQKYFNTKYDSKHKISFKNKVSKISFEPIDSYSAELLVDFKDKTTNSLQQIMAN